MQHISSIKDIASHYKLFLIDQWGVLHNGQSILGQAKKALSIIKTQSSQSHVIILSNSGKRASHSFALMRSLGFDMSHIDHVLTSGEASYQWMLKEQNHILKDKKYCMVFSWDKDRTLLQGLSFHEVNTIEQADFIINAGLDRGACDDYRLDLEIAQKKQLPMICTNPDLVAQNADGTLKDCPGKTALLYREMGGEVLLFGKPEKDIYDMALYLAQQHISSIMPHEVLCIGDSLTHDIQGAQRQKFDSLFIESGIHAFDIKHKKTSLYQEHKVQPTYIATYFE